eukprot:403366513
MKNQYSKECRKCRQPYDDQRRSVIIEKCKHVVCEKCYQKNLKIYENTPKTCPICYFPSSEKDFRNQDIKVNDPKQDVCLNPNKKVSNRYTTTIHKLPRINPEDVPNESQLNYKYRREQYLGSGTFGDVYSISRISKFAIKTFKAQPTEREMFEVRVMKGIKSQYICTLHDFFISQDGKYNIIQDYAQFGDLRKYCKDVLNWNVPEDLAKEWLACVVLGLKELHSRGIIHRDIKPDNILVFKNDEVKIADYGEANVISDEQSTGIYGTLDYASPEMLNRNGYDYSTDIHSLGKTFIYLLTRKIPSQKETNNPQWFPFIKGMSQEFITLLRRMVSYNSKDRPTVVDLMFDPLISETKVMKEYKKAQNVMTLGDVAFSQKFMSQISKGGIGCNNCSLILCDKCFRKKVELSFLMLNDIIGQANDITIKIEELLKDTKVQLDGCQRLCPLMEVSQYSRIFNDSEQMIEESASNQQKIKNQNCFKMTEVSQLILDFKTKDVQKSKHANDDIQFKKDSNLRFSHVFGFYTSAQNCQKTNEGIIFTDKNAFIFNFSQQTIHMVSENAKYSMIATDKRLQIGGNMCFKDTDILIDLIFKDKNTNSSLLSQSSPSLSDSFKFDKKESKIIIGGTKAFLVQQVEIYQIQ